MKPKPHQVFCNLLNFPSNAIEVKDPINKEAVDRVRHYQIMRRPGGIYHLIDKDNPLCYPQYGISKGQLYREHVLHDDIKIAMATPAMNKFTSVDIQENILPFIHRLSICPFIWFSMSLPYLVSENPTKEGLYSIEKRIDVYKGFENMLFEICMELDKGHSFTSELILLKVNEILGVPITVSLPQLENIDEVLMYLKIRE